MFAQVNNSAWDSLDAQLSDNTLRVLNWLVRHTDFYGFVYASKTDISEALGKDKALITRAFKELYALGVVKTVATRKHEMDATLVRRSCFKNVVKLSDRRKNAGK